MVIAVHPDDESLAAGGLIHRAVAAGAAVRIVFITNGDNNPWPQRIVEKRWTIGPADRQRWGARRRREALAALAALGIRQLDTVYLDLPDQGVTDILLGERNKLVARLRDEIDGFNTTLLVGPSSCDLHPDHSATAVLLRLALDLPPRRADALTHLDYLVHVRDDYTAQAETALQLSPQELERKRAAIVCHESQFCFRSKKFLGMAKPTEVFFSHRLALPGQRRHQPIRRAAIGDSTLVMDLEMQSRLGAFGPATIHLLDGDGPAIRFNLPRSASAASITAYRTAGPSVGAVNATGRGGKWQLSVDTSMLHPDGPLFAKVERRFGFFDEAGWCEIRG